MIVQCGNGLSAIKNGNHESQKKGGGKGEVNTVQASLQSAIDDPPDIVKNTGTAFSRIQILNNGLKDIQRSSDKQLSLEQARALDLTGVTASHVRAAYALRNGTDKEKKYASATESALNYLYTKGISNKIKNQLAKNYNEETFGRLDGDKWTGKNISPGTQRMYEDLKVRALKMVRAGDIPDYNGITRKPRSSRPKKVSKTQDSDDLFAGLI